MFEVARVREQTRPRRMPAVPPPAEGAKRQRSVPPKFNFTVACCSYRCTFKAYHPLARVTPHVIQSDLSMTEKQAV